MVKAKDLTFEYFRRDDSGNVEEVVDAVKDLSLEIHPGEFVGILGRNGSGKSTLAKMINAILPPTEGTLFVGGMDASDEDFIWNIRRTAGMVFQNPDNQIVGTVVEEDVAFGPENLGVPSKEIHTRVTDALSLVGLTEYAKISPQKLSGGQKQRLAIAGVLAMKPKCIIFDESTSMLDPKGRAEILSLAKELNREEKITIIFITHEPEEVLDADRIYVLDRGELVLSGTPKEVFAKHDILKSAGLLLPPVADMAVCLKEAGLSVELPVLTTDDFVSEIHRLMAYRKLTEMESINRNGNAYSQKAIEHASSKDPSDTALQSMTKGLVLSDVSFSYGKKEKQVLRKVSFSVAPGEIVALVGPTGAGKSTLLQLMNGLLKPSEGQIYYCGKDCSDSDFSGAELRKKVGLVFQYPEDQLFGETVYKDVSFGPKNIGLPLLEVQKRTFDAISRVGLPDSVYDLLPYELSGGQRRSVAIAGVLALGPDLLILDEPAAGLDPESKKNLFAMLNELREDGKGILFVSHDMNEVAEYADRVLVLNAGEAVFDGTVRELFADRNRLNDWCLLEPTVTKCMRELKASGYLVDTGIYTKDEACKEVLTLFN